MGKLELEAFGWNLFGWGDLGEEDKGCRLCGGGKLP